MAVSKSELEDLTKNFSGDNVDSMFASGLFTTPKYLSSSRSIMAASFQTQRVIPKDPQFPFVYTGYENAFGSYADSITKTEKNFRVIDVISKFPNLPRHIYLYIVQDIITGQYDVIDIKHYISYSETHGTVKPQTEGDLFTTGSVIPQNTILAHAPSHDGHGNYCCGINAKTAYVSWPEVEEDGFAVSDEFARNTKIYQITEESVIVNNNIILPNLYGDNDIYKGFPDVGEEIKNGIVCARRQINYQYAASELTKNSLSKLLDGDKAIPGRGKIIDIDIFVNNEDELINNENRTQIMQYWLLSKMYHERIVNTLGHIVRNKNNLYTYRLRLMYERSVDFLNQNIKFTSSNGIFEFALINFTICWETSIHKGFKLADRHGSKGVITHIIPKEFMPRDAYGTIADILQSPPGIVGRANIAQNYEHELNFCSAGIRRIMLENTKNGINKQFAILYDYMEMIDTEQANELKKSFELCSTYDKTEYIADVIANGIYIRQAPFNGTITLEQLEAIYEKFNIKPSRVRSKRIFKYHGENRNRMSLVDKDDYFAFLRNYNNKKDVFVNELTPQILKDKINILDDISDDEFVFTNEYTCIDSNGNLYKVKGDSDNNYKVTDYPDYRSLDEKLLDCVNEETTVEYRRDHIIRGFLSRDPVIIADKFFMILKHVPESKLSARFIGSTSPLGMPNKTAKSELNGPISGTPIKIGDMEAFNFVLRTDPSIVCENLSAIAKNPELRKLLVQKLLFDDPLQLHDIEMPKEEMYNDIPAKQLKAYMYCLGLELLFNGQEDIYEPFDTVNMTTEEMVESIKQFKDDNKFIY
jgi:hypothetical protein